MADFYTALKSSIRDSVCSFLNDAANWKRTFDKIGPIPTPNADLPNAPAIAAGLFCNREPSVPQVPPPFTGGQCAIFYKVSGFYVRRDSSTPTCQTFSTNFTNVVLLGPIQGAAVRQPYEFTCTPSGQKFNDTYQQGVIIHNNGQESFVIAGTDAGVISIAITSVTPLNPSEPDNCGNPAPPPPPAPAPNSNVFTPTVVFQDDNNVDVTISPTIIIGVAYVNATAEINIPVTVDVGGINVNANINLSTGDINIGGSYDSNDDSYNPPAANPCECEPSTGTDDAPPSRPPGVPEPPSDTTPPQQGKRRLVGAIVTVTDAKGQDRIENSLYSAPDVGVPYYALLFFGYQLDNGVLAWSGDFPIKVRQQFVPCPFPEAAVGAVAAPRFNGQTVQVTPVFRKDEAVRETEPIT